MVTVNCEKSRAVNHCIDGSSSAAWGRQLSGSRSPRTHASPLGRVSRS